MQALTEISRLPFLRALSEFVELARQQEAHLGLMLIDLTNLSSINHYHGYATGDAVLARAYRQLLSVSKLPDTVFRVGDHRFAFILPGWSLPGRGTVGRW